MAHQSDQVRNLIAEAAAGVTPLSRFASDQDVCIACLSDGAEEYTYHGKDYTLHGGYHPTIQNGSTVRMCIPCAKDFSRFNKGLTKSASDNQRMVGSVCTGCGLPANKNDGKVTQRDLGSPDKWHRECYQMYNRRLKRNPNADVFHGDPENDYRSASLKATSAQWVRVSNGHYDATDGQWRIDTCSSNSSRWDLYELTDYDGYSSSWEEIACRTSMRELQQMVQELEASGKHVHVEPDAQDDDLATSFTIRSRKTAYTECPDCGGGVLGGECTVCGAAVADPSFFRNPPEDDYYDSDDTSVDSHGFSNNSENWEGPADISAPDSLYALKPSDFPHEHSETGGICRNQDDCRMSMCMYSEMTPAAQAELRAAAGNTKTAEKAEAQRIPNGTMIEIPSLEWVGVVVDQIGDKVRVTGPSNDFLDLPRNRIQNRVFSARKTASRRTAGDWYPDEPYGGENFHDNTGDPGGQWDSQPHNYVLCGTCGMATMPGPLCEFCHNPLVNAKPWAETVSLDSDFWGKLIDQTKPH